MDAEVRFTARIPSDDYNKLRVVAAMRRGSINLTLCDAIDAYLQKWEEDNGEIQIIESVSEEKTIRSARKKQSGQQGQDGVAV